MSRCFHSRWFLTGLTAFCLVTGGTLVLATETEESTASGSHGVSIMAEPAIPTAHYLTSSIVVAIICTILLLVLSRRATRRMELIPRGTQNLFEALVEGLYDMLEGI